MDIFPTDSMQIKRNYKNDVFNLIGKVLSSLRLIFA